MKPKWNISFHVEEAASLDAKHFFLSFLIQPNKKKKTFELL